MKLFIFAVLSASLLVSGCSSVSTEAEAAELARAAQATKNAEEYAASVAQKETDQTSTEAAALQAAEATRLAEETAAAAAYEGEVKRVNSTNGCIEFTNAWKYGDKPTGATLSGRMGSAVAYANQGDLTLADLITQTSSALIMSDFDSSYEQQAQALVDQVVEHCLQNGYMVEAE